MGEGESGTAGQRPASTATDDLRVEVDGKRLIPVHPAHAGVLTPARPSDAPGRPSPGEGRPARRRTRHNLLGRLLLVVLCCALVLAALGAGGAWWLQRKYDANIERFGNPFTAIPPASRPAPLAPEAMNILLLGSDSRISAGDPSQWVAGGQRTDAIMVAHVPADRSAVQIISIPRDSWVNVPGHGRNKINAAFSFGGPALMVQTVEQVTRTRMDHVVVADFTGFTEITDALGGVVITVPEATGDDREKFPAGTRRMDGATALNYVRQRHNLPGGDFDRVKRQQNWIRSVLMEAMDRGTLTDLRELNAVLDATTRSIATDDGFTFGEMRDLALSLRAARKERLTFLTAPVAGTGWSPDGKQAIVRLDAPEGAVLWQAVARDRMGAWLAAHGGTALGDEVR